MGDFWPISTSQLRRSDASQLTILSGFDEQLLTYATRLRWRNFTPVYRSSRKRPGRFWAIYRQRSCELLPIRHRTFVHVKKRIFYNGKTGVLKADSCTRIGNLSSHGHFYRGQRKYLLKTNLYTIYTLLWNYFRILWYIDINDIRRMN